MRTPLACMLRVMISPWNSWPDFLKEPMLAMVLLLAVFELRDHRGLDGDLEAGGDRRRTHSGRSAAEDGGGETFLAREEWANRGPRAPFGAGGRAPGENGGPGARLGAWGRAQGKKVSPPPLRFRRSRRSRPSARSSQ